MSPTVPRRIAIAVAALGVVVIFALREDKPRPPPPETAARELQERARSLREEQLEPSFEALEPLHHPVPPPQPGDWLAEHDEPGQSVGDYVLSSPTRATPERRTLYLMPIGDFTPAQQQAVADTADFLARFYQLPVVTLDALPASEIPPEATRKNPQGGQLQVLTTYIMEKVLLPRRPDDAMAVLGLTAIDLYPADDWNFVFGEASLEARVGVWSLYRNGDPEKEPKLFLMRTLKTAAHELGHQFSLHHCITWACVMNGSNHQREADHQPATLGPACLQKLQWNIGFDPLKRAKDLEAFYAAHGYPQEAALEAATAKVLSAFDAGIPAGDTGP